MGILSELEFRKQWTAIVAIFTAVTSNIFWNELKSCQALLFGKDMGYLGVWRITELVGDSIQCDIRGKENEIAKVLTQETIFNIKI